VLGGVALGLCVGHQSLKSRLECPSDLLRWVASEAFGFEAAVKVGQDLGFPRASSGTNLCS
jgi:hypothetical protein